MNTPSKYGPYELITCVASGGMAEIFLAKTRDQRGDDRFLAVKMIREQLATDQELIETLVTEQRLAVGLNHDNIVQVFDLVSYDDRVSITMEFVAGRDVQKLLTRVTQAGYYLPFEVVAYIIAQACAGLYYAHTSRDERGLPLRLVHRDISPQNLLVSFNGDVKVTDFGIAKANIRRRETQAGILKGKFGYMSPEQAWGDKVDARSDVYSLGVVLFEMLTGKLLHQDADSFRTLEAVRRGEIQSPIQHRADIPMDLEAIVMLALERDRNERFASAEAMQQELLRFLQRNHPNYGPLDLARYMRRVFRQDVDALRQQPHGKQLLQNLDAKQNHQDTRQVLLQRESYIPDRETSLVFNVRHMQAQLAAQPHNTPGQPPPPRSSTSPSRPPRPASFSMEALERTARRASSSPPSWSRPAAPPASAGLVFPDDSGNLPADIEDIHNEPTRISDVNPILAAERVARFKEGQPPSALDEGDGLETISEPAPPPELFLEPGDDPLANIGDDTHDEHFKEDDPLEEARTRSLSDARNKAFEMAPTQEYRSFTQDDAAAMRARRAAEEIARRREEAEAKAAAEGRPESAAPSASKPITPLVETPPATRQPPWLLIVLGVVVVVAAVIVALML